MFAFNLKRFVSGKDKLFLLAAVCMIAAVLVFTPVFAQAPDREITNSFINNSNDAYWVYENLTFKDITITNPSGAHRLVIAKAGTVNLFEGTKIILQDGTSAGPLIAALAEDGPDKPEAVITFKNVTMTQEGSFTGVYLRAGGNYDLVNYHPGGIIKFEGENTFKGLKTGTIRNDGQLIVKDGTTTFEDCNLTLGTAADTKGTWIIEDGATLVIDGTIKPLPSDKPVFVVKPGGTLKFTETAKLDLSAIGTSVAIDVEPGGTLVMTDDNITGGSDANIKVEKGIADFTITKTWVDNSNERNVRPTAENYEKWLTMTIGEESFTLDSEKFTGLYGTAVVTVNEENPNQYIVTVTGKKTALTNYTPVGDPIEFTLTEEEYDYYTKGENDPVKGEDGNYTITNTINDRTVLMPTITNVSVVWDGQAHPLTISSLMGSDGTDYTNQIKPNIAYIKEGETDPIQGDPKDAGTYTAVLTLNDTDAVHNVLHKHDDPHTVTITKAQIPVESFTAPAAAAGLVYKGTEQELLSSAGSWKETDKEYGTFHYSVSFTAAKAAPEGYLPIAPKATDAGTYTIAWMIEGNDNHFDYTPESAEITATIAKADIPEDSFTAPAAAEGLKFTGSEQNLIKEGTGIWKEGQNYGTFQYKVGSGDFADSAKGTFVESYSIEWKITGDNNHNDYTPADGAKILTAAIAEGEIPEDSFIAPAAAEGLKYTGAEQDLIKTGTGTWTAVEYGTFLYKVSFVPAKTAPEGFSAIAPKGKEIGTYTIEWMIEGDENHIDYTDGTPFEVTIAEAEPVVTPDLKDADITITNQADLVADGTEKKVEITVSYNGEPLTEGTDYAIEGTTTATEPGTYTITITGLGRFVGTQQVLAWTITEQQPGPGPQPGPQPVRPGFHFVQLPGFWDRERNCPSFGCGMELPATGFPTRVNVPLSVRPEGLNYRNLNMRLQIPALELDTDLIGVPELDNSWAVEWIGDKAGLLSGTSYPGEGYSVIAAHNHLNNTETGPFLALGSLESGDKVFVNAADGSLISFSVYANELLAPTDMEKVASVAEQFENSLVLITCENETVEGGYANRRVIFAKPY